MHKSPCNKTGYLVFRISYSGWCIWFCVEFTCFGLWASLSMTNTFFKCLGQICAATDIVDVVNDADGGCGDGTGVL